MLTSAAVVLTFLVCAFGVFQDRLRAAPDLVVDGGMDGPFMVEPGPDGDVTGAMVDAVHRGITYGFYSTLCPAPDVALSGQSKLRFLPKDEVILTRGSEFAPDKRGCRPLLVEIAIPVSAPLGLYDVERVSIVSRAGVTPSLRTFKPSRSFEVSDR